MIDGVGKSRAGARIELPRAFVERSVAAGKTGDALGQRNVGGPGSAAAGLASGGPPVDSGKVAAIRAAMAEGRYPVDPDRIAEAMIELDLPRKPQA
jgi:negative regulator of flagellin synthesis FlgM